MQPGPTDQLRTACEAVALRSRHVRINPSKIAPYAKALVDDGLARTPTPDDASPLAPGEREEAAARVLILDAINFGSGWFPTLRKPDGLSGFRTIAKALDDRFAAHGVWTPDELTRITPRTLGPTLHQDEAHPLVPLLVASLNDLGLRINHVGSWSQLVDANPSALDLVATLATWACFEDVSTYDNLELPFLKRAQIAAADLHRAGVVHYADLHRLTIFADNLVPHVLTLDGVLQLDEALTRHIANGKLIEHGSKPEVELRACAVHAAELLTHELGGISAAELDTFLWERGGGPAYKAKPRPRSRTTAY